MKRYKVTRDAQGRQDLHHLIAAGRAAAPKLTHARILLKADAADGGPARPGHQIADASEVSVATGERVRQRFVERGLDAAPDRKRRERPARGLTRDGHAEAHSIALACSAPPTGPTTRRGRVRLLCNNANSARFPPPTPRWPCRPKTRAGPAVIAMRRLIPCLGESEPSSGSPTDCEPTALPSR